MFTSTAPRLEGDAFSLLGNQSQAAKKKKNPRCQIRLFAGSRGSVQEGENECSHPRGVFLISPQRSSLLATSPRQHGNSGGEKPPRRHGGELSAIRNAIFKTRGKRRHKGTWN